MIRFCSILVGLILVTRMAAVDGTFTVNPMETSAQSLPTGLPGISPVSGSAIVLADGRVFVGRGSSTYLYNPTTNVWTATAAALYANATYILLDNGLILGCGDTIQCQLYNPTTNSWSATGTSTIGANHVMRTGIKMNDGRVLLCMGQHQTMGGSTGHAEIYNPGTGTWTAVASMVGTGRMGSAVILASGKVLVMKNDGSGTNGTQVYDPTGNSWTTTTNVPPRYYNCPMVRLASGNVLMGYGLPVDPPDVYNEGTNTWSDGSAFPAGILMRRPGVTRTPSGNFLFYGSEWNGSNAEDSVWMYNDGPAGWVWCGGTALTRGAPLMVTLQDGRMMAMGGINGNGNGTYQFFTEILKNTAPIFTKGANVAVNEDSGAFSQANWATGIAKGSAPIDEAGQVLTFTVTNDNNALFSVQPSLTAIGTLSFTPTVNLFGSATVTVTLSDNGGTQGGGVDTSASQTFVIDVNSVNDAPSFTMPATLSVARTAGAQTDVGWVTGISPGPSNESAQTVSLAVTNNTNAALFSAGPAVTNSGTLTFTPADTAGGTATITITATDTGGTANGGVATSSSTFTITITPVNHPPVLDTAGTFTLSTILEDQTGNAGDLISAMIATSLANGGDAITDFEGLEGILIESMSVGSMGVFEFSTNGGSTWSTVDAAQLSANNKLHLAATSQTRIRFVPSTNKNSVDGTPTFIFRAWDQSDGTTGAAFLAWNGTYRTTTGFGGASPYSSSSDSCGITVTPVNDVPGFTKGADQLLDENASLSQTASGWATAISEGAANESSQTVTFTVTNDNTALFAIAPTVSASGTLSWTFNPSIFGEATITVRISDDGGTANGGQNQSATQTAVISIYPVTPTVSAATTLENVQSSAGLVITKNPLDTAGRTTHYKITSISNGTLFLADGTTSVVNNQFITLAQGAAGLRITPTAFFNGNATFQIRAARGPNDLSLMGNAITATCTVQPVNQPPSFTKGADVTVARNSGNYFSSGWATAISEGPANESSQTLTFIVTNDNNSLFNTQPSISASGALSFTPADTAGGTTTVTVTLKDNGGTANGGSDTSAPQTFTIIITPVNHQPALYNTQPFTLSAVLQNTAAPTGDAIQAIIDSSTANVGDAIVDVEGGEGLLLVGQTGNGSLGQWQYSLNGGTSWTNLPNVIPTNALHLRAVANNKLRFVPATNKNSQDGVPTITARAWDGSDGTTGAINGTWDGTFRNADAVVGGNYGLATAPYSSNTVSVTCAVTPVNQSPSFTKGTDQVVDPVTSLTYSISGWATAIAAGPANVYENAQSVSFVVTNDANAQFSVQPAVSSSGTLSFTLAPNASGVVNLTVRAQDNAGTANGGVDQSANQTFTITIISITPQVTPASTLENQQTTSGLVITRNANDNPPQANYFKITGIQNGTLFQADGTTPIANGAFITIAQGAAGLRFTPTAFWNNGDGVASISVQAALTNADASLRGSVVQGVVSVTAVNQPPTFVPGTNQTVYEGSGAQSVPGWATSITKGPANESSQTVTFQVTNDNTPLFSSQPAISATGTLTYTLSPNVYGTANVTVVARDNGGTANGGNDSAAPVNFVINVLWANQPPTFTLGGSPTALEDSGPYSAPNWIAAVSPGPTPNEASQVVNYNVTNNNNALFSVQPAIATNGTLTFTPATNAFGVATVSVQAYDDGGTANGGNNTSPVQTFTITLAGVNDTPSFTKGTDVSVFQGASVQSFPAWATAIAAGPINESDQVLTFVVTVDNPGIFLVAPAISATGTLTLTPSAVTYGSATVTVRLRDNAGTANGGSDQSPPQTFNVTVGYVNQAPSFVKGPNQNVDDATTSVTVPNWATSISKGPNNTAENAQTVTFIVTNDNPSLFSTQPAISPTGTLTYTLVNNALGSALVSVVIKDDGGTANGGTDTSVAQSFTIVASRYTPTITDASTVENVQTTAGLVVTRNAQDTTPIAQYFKITNIQNGTLFHADGVTPISNNAFIDFAAANAGLRFTPTIYWNSTKGVASFRVQASSVASNGGLIGNQVTATIYVDPVNQPPVNSIAPIVAGAFHPGVTVTSSTGTWTNPDSASPITYAFQWQIADTAGGVGQADVSGATAASYLVPVTALGKYLRVVVTATDTDAPEPLAGGGTTSPASTSLPTAWVLVANVAPVIAGNSTVTVTMNENGAPLPFSLTLNASDADGDVITWAVGSAATHGTAGVSSNPAGTVATVSYSPVTDYNGTDAFVLTATDPSGGTASVTVNVVIQPVNNPPTNTVAPSIAGTGIVGSTLTASPGKWDDNRDNPSPGTLTFTYQWQRAIDAAGTGAVNIPSATGTTYQPVTADSGKYLRVVVTCTDTSTNGSSPATIAVTANSLGILARLPLGTLTVSSVTVTGVVTGGRVDRVRIDGVEVPFDPNTNGWTTIVPFSSDYDSQMIQVEAFGPGVSSGPTRTTVDTVHVPVGGG